jgi:hypothetical protein
MGNPVLINHNKLIHSLINSLIQREKYFTPFYISNADFYIVNFLYKNWIFHLMLHGFRLFGLLQRFSLSSASDFSTF